MIELKIREGRKTPLEISQFLGFSLSPGEETPFDTVLPGVSCAGRAVGENAVMSTLTKADVNPSGLRGSE